MKEITLNRGLFLASLLCVVGYAICAVKVWRQTYDPAEAMNPMSAVPVSGADLQLASACARDVVGAEMRQGLSPTRSKLFYAEWRCDIAARNSAKSRT